MKDFFLLLKVDPKFRNRVYLICLAGALLASVVILVVTTIRSSKTIREAQAVIEQNHSRELFYLEWQERIIRQTPNEHTKALYLSYASNLILTHYRENPSNLLPMSTSELYDFLDIIYQYAMSGVFSSASYPDGLFLPLAYAAVESNFYPAAIGLDGERSVFQFMVATAEDTYQKSGRPFISNFWVYPKESVWLWFNYYRKISSHFPTTDVEKQIRWSALAYNAGLHRNQLLPYYQAGHRIETYLRDFSYQKGNSSYNRHIYQTFLKYRDGFLSVK